PVQSDRLGGVAHVAALLVVGGGGEVRLGRGCGGGVGARGRGGLQLGVDDLGIGDVLLRLAVLGLGGDGGGGPVLLTLGPVRTFLSTAREIRSRPGRLLGAPGTVLGLAHPLLPRVEGARAGVCVPGTAVRVAAEEPTLLIGGVRFGVFGVAASVLGLTVRFGVLGSGPGRLLPGPGRLLGGPGGALAVALTATLLPALLSLTLDPVPPGPTLTCV